MMCAWIFEFFQSNLKMMDARVITDITIKVCATESFPFKWEAVQKAVWDSKVKEIKARALRQSILDDTNKTVGVYFQCFAPLLATAFSGSIVSKYSTNDAVSSPDSAVIVTSIVSFAPEGSTSSLRIQGDEWVRVIPFEVPGMSGPSTPVHTRVRFPIQYDSVKNEEDHALRLSNVIAKRVKCHIRERDDAVKAFLLSDRR